MPLSWPDILGTLPGWITSGGVVALLVTLVKRGVQMRGLENADVADIRTHWATELKALRDRQDSADRRDAEREKSYAAALKLAEERWQESSARHAECEEQRSKLFDELAGLKRQIAQYSANRLLILEDGPPGASAPDAMASAKRVKDIGNGDK